MFFLISELSSVVFRPVTNQRTLVSSWCSFSFFVMRRGSSDRTDESCSSWTVTNSS